MVDKISDLTIEWWKSNKAGEWYWHAKTNNGDIVAAAGHYNSSASAIKGIAVTFGLPVKRIRQEAAGRRRFVLMRWIEPELLEMSVELTQLPARWKG